MKKNWHKRTRLIILISQCNLLFRLRHCRYQYTRQPFSALQMAIIKPQNKLHLSLNIIPEIQNFKQVTIIVVTRMMLTGPEIADWYTYIFSALLRPVRLANIKIYDLTIHKGNI